MKLPLSPRHVIRLFTDLAAITAVSVIFAVGATKAGVGYDPDSDALTHIAAASN